jgi:hypothetical protein
MLRLTIALLALFLMVPLHGTADADPVTLVQMRGFVPPFPIPPDFSGDLALFVGDDPENGLLLGHFKASEFSATHVLYVASSAGFPALRNAIFRNGLLDLNFAFRYDGGAWVKYLEVTDPGKSNFDFLAAWFATYSGSEKIFLTSIELSFTEDNRAAFLLIGHQVPPLRCILPC